MLNYFNYFLVSLTLDDNNGNKIFVSHQLLEVTGNISIITKLIIDHYLKTYDIKSNKFKTHYLNSNLYIDKSNLVCTSEKIDPKFVKLQKEFSKQIKKYLLL